MEDTSSIMAKNRIGVSPKKAFFVEPVGSLIGFIATIAIGFTIYFILTGISIANGWIPYDKVVLYAADNVFYKLIWMIMNFSEPQFYAGIFASAGIILGGFAAWRLEKKKSRLSGFGICYGTNLWPWIFSSQLLSWLPTFISIVGVPPTVMFKYGPSMRALLTGSILGGTMSFPVAFWIMTRIIYVLDLPVVVGSVFTMAITEIIVLEVCKVLPWMKINGFEAASDDSSELSTGDRLKQMSKPAWFIRRVFADFSEAQFYGNEIAGLMIIMGVCLDFIINASHPAYGSGAIPAIILSQFVGSATGVFLYFNRYVEDGGYATFIPVVSVGPACVLALGATIPVALTAGVLGGMISSPVADFLVKRLPEELHPTIGNVTSMGICTTVVYIIMKALPWF
jgi:hypothetical protein